MEPLSIAFTRSLADPSNPTSQNGRSPKPAGLYSVAAPWLHCGLWLPRGYPAATPRLPRGCPPWLRLGRAPKHGSTTTSIPLGLPLILLLVLPWSPWSPACPPVVVPRLSSRLSSCLSPRWSSRLSSRSPSRSSFCWPFSKSDRSLSVAVGGHFAPASCLIDGCWGSLCAGVMFYRWLLGVTLRRCHVLSLFYRPQNGNKTTIQHL